MKRYLLSFACFIGLFPLISSNGIAVGKNKPIQTSCSVEKSDCWATLAQTVDKNPTVSHFKLDSSQDTGGFAVANSIMSTSREYKWFYNRKTGNVDFKVTYYEPPDDWGTIGQRTRYSGVNTQFFKLLSQQKPSISDVSFNSFAAKNGVRIEKYITDSRPQKQEVN